MTIQEGLGMSVWIIFNWQMLIARKVLFNYDEYWR